MEAVENAVDAWTELASAEQHVMSSLDIWLHVYRLKTSDSTVLDRIVELASEKRWNNDDHDPNYEVVCRVVEQRVRMAIEAATVHVSLKLCRGILEWMPDCRPALRFVLQTHLSWNLLPIDASWIDRLRRDNADHALIHIVDGLDYARAEDFVQVSHRTRSTWLLNACSKK